MAGSADKVFCVPGVAKRHRMSRARLKLSLERVYAAYTKRELVDPDPLAAVHAFSEPRDQEVAGLLAAALAFGNVKQILRALDQVFARLPAPHEELLDLSDAELAWRFADFQYRYIRGEQIGALLRGVRSCLREHGSLGRAFAAQLRPGEHTVVPALARFVTLLDAAGGVPRNYLLPNPARGSACKRLFLYLRWMVRKDVVDLGIWDVPPRLLIVPLDTHMHQMALALGLTQRRQANLAAALEVTEGFRRLVPEDPVRYDFALTRVGIRKEISLEDFLARWC